MKMEKIACGLSLLAAGMMLAACNSGPVVTRATGFAYEAVVVMEKDYWDGPAGEAVNGQLEAPVAGLPQAEPSIKVSYSQPKDFNGLLKYVRNILIVDIDPDIYTKVSLSEEKDCWASGQLVLTLKAPSPELIADYTRQYPGRLTEIFVKEEMSRAVRQLEKTYSSTVMGVLKKNHRLALNVPEEIVYYKDTADFFWATNNASTGRMDVVVYTFPYTDPETFTAGYLVAMRDSMLKANLPGSFPGSYMATETKYLDVDYSPIELEGKYCGVMRGLWKMVGDMMGGPFVSHTRLDEKNQRVVVAEGFVYAPETDKRNYIRRIEAALFTLRLPGEYDAPEDDGKPEEGGKPK